MPTKRRRDGLEELSELFAGVPWWFPFVLAVAFWFLVPLLGPKGVHDRAWDGLWRLIGGAGAALIVLAGIAAQFTKLHRRNLVAQSTSLDALRGSDLA